MEPGSSAVRIARWRRFERVGTFVERAGVPCVIRDAKQRLGADFQWFPFDREEAFDKVAVVFSEVARV